MSIDSTLYMCDGIINYFDGTTEPHLIELCSYHNNRELHKYLVDHIEGYDSSSDWYGQPVEIPIEVFKNIPSSMLSKCERDTFDLDNIFKLLNNTNKFYYEADW